MVHTGATANLGGFRWLERHTRLLGRKGFQKVSTCPSTARFRLGDGRFGEVSHVADIPVGVAGERGKFAAFALDAGAPAFLPKGAMEAPGWQPDFSRDPLALHEQGATRPRRVNRMGRHILRVVDLGENASGKVCGPVNSASFFE